MDTMMNASVIEGSPKKLVYQRVPIPSYGPDQVLVNVKYAGICGSDVHGFLDPNSKGRIPGLIMGHECSGVIAGVGENVEGFKVGDRVAVDPQYRCGHCYYCNHGWYNICAENKIIGSALRGFVNGCFAEYVPVSFKQVLKLPENLSLKEASMVEPLGNAVHMTHRADIQVGDTVVVIGAGTLGLCMMQAAKVAGAGKIIISDLADFRLEIAKDLGADITVGSGQDLQEIVLQETNGIGADVVVEAVGVEATYRQSIALVRKRGTIVFFGAVTDHVDIPLMPILHKEINIVGSTGFDCETQMTIDLMASKRIDVDPIITHVYPLSQAQEAVDMMTAPGNTAIKVVLEIG